MALTLDFEKPLLELERQIGHLKRLAEDRDLDVDAEIAPLVSKLDELRREVYADLTPMQRVQVARHPKRPFTLDYIEALFTDFIESTSQVSHPSGGYSARDRGEDRAPFIVEDASPLATLRTDGSLAMSIR